MLKRYSYNFSGSPVELDNRINLPEPNKPEEELSPEEKARLEREERERSEKRRFNEMVDERVREILDSQREAVANESQQIIENAKAQAQKLTDDTRAAAKNVLEKAAVEGERIKEQSKKDGYKDGYAQGKADAEKKCESYLDAAGQFINEINAKKESYYISNEQQLRETVYEIVEKITLQKLESDDKMVERIIAHAARNFRNSDFVRISVMEGDVSKEFTADAEYVKSIAANIPDIEVEYLSPSDNPKGTVILDNDSEIIDASVPTQLEFLKEIMKKTRGETDENEAAESAMAPGSGT